MIAEHAGSQAAAKPAAESTADEQRSAAPLNNLSSKAKSAALWNLGFNLFRDVLQFAQMLILARLLDEAAYGQKILEYTSKLV